MDSTFSYPQEVSKRAELLNAQNNAAKLFRSVYPFLKSKTSSPNRKAPNKKQAPGSRAIKLRTVLYKKPTKQLTMEENRLPLGKQWCKQSSSWRAAQSIFPRS